MPPLALDARGSIPENVCHPWHIRPNYLGGAPSRLLCRGRGKCNPRSVQKRSRADLKSKFNYLQQNAESQAFLASYLRDPQAQVAQITAFNNAKVDQAFFPDGRYKSNFLCNIGHGDHSKLFDRSPRLSFEEACTFA